MTSHKRHVCKDHHPISEPAGTYNMLTFSVLRKIASVGLVAVHDILERGGRGRW